MPSITALTRIFFVSAACCALFACGKANEQAPALSSVNKHPDTWLTGHRAAYRLSPNQCRECHGTDLSGGVTKIGCSTNSCHSGNHPPRDIIHPVLFKGTPDLNKAHGGMAKKDLIICQDCHGTPGGAGSNSRFNRPIGSLTTGCEASGCHNDNMAHPKLWRGHVNSGNQANACALCHGASFEGGTGPKCSSCHTRLFPGLIPASGTCVSCHGNPPSGTSAPNRPGSHVVHLSIPEVKGKCEVCHTGGGSGTANHGSSLTVAFASAYNASSGAASYDSTAKTCANIKCHGGQTTPAWGEEASCTGCHTSGVAPYNVSNTGKHNIHVTAGLACTDCHIMSNSAAPAHFSNLSSAVFNQSASNTLRSDNTGYLNYNKASQTCFASGPIPAGVTFGACHSGIKPWR